MTFYLLNALYWFGWCFSTVVLAICAWLLADTGYTYAREHKSSQDWFHAGLLWLFGGGIVGYEVIEILTFFQ